MTDANEATGQRDRSPAFPVIALDGALGKLAEFETHYKRSAARPEKVGEAWGIKTKAYADRIAAALRYFGLLEYQGSGQDRRVVVSEEGRKYLRAQQEETKREIAKTAALRPKQIARFWNDWGADRPADAACLDDLMLKHGFSEGGARDFLKVYDATITYAKLSDSDKPPPEAGDDAPEDNDDNDEVVEDRTPPPPKGKVRVMEGERVVFTEEIDPQTYVKLIASGFVDDGLLEALEDYVKRQRKRLNMGVPRHAITGEKPPETILGGMGGDDEAAN
jgi:hypothetical protein